MENISKLPFIIFNHLSFPLCFISWTGLFLSVLSLMFFLALTFIISGAEVAFFSLDSSDLQNIQENHKTNRIVYLLKHPKELLASLIIANTFVNLLIILFLNLKLEIYLHSWLHSEIVLELCKIGVEIFVIILFAEVLPKIYASKNNIRFALLSQTLVFLIFKLFYKLSLRLNVFSNFLEKKLKATNINLNYGLLIDDLKHAIELTSDREEKKDELLMLKSIADFKTKTVKQVMTTRSDVKAFSNKLSFSKIKSQIVELQFARVPTYQKNIDNIIGVLHTKDLLPFLKEKSNFRWQKYVKEPLFVIENQNLDYCLKQMQEKHAQLAIVMDEFGITQGVISFEDIVEEIVGEIVDEFDAKEKKMKLNHSNKMIEVDAKISLKEFVEIYKLKGKEFDGFITKHESLAGFLLELFEEIPQVGKSIKWNRFKFTVIKANKKRILKVRVKLGDKEGIK